MKKMFVPFIACLFMLTFSVSSQAVPRTAFVHLFEWQWPDIASECENQLGPNGFSAVQVSPPQKSISGSAWWTRYQPVSYSIEGRSGTRAQFIDMVNRCKAVGVEIYVDAVVNHMAAGNRSYPDVPYSSNDFHTCTTGIDYSNRWQVQNCDLEGLNDLKTESDYVRGKIAAYINDLKSLGVAGFRIDAAKHMPAADVSNIIGRLMGSPYIFQEVIGAAGEPVQPSEYTYISDVTEFSFSKTLGYYFKGRGALKEIKNIGVWSGWLPSSDAVVFVANHDNQRQDTNNTITHKDGGNLNNLAHVFMLAWPYGYPKVMSSYEWTDHDQGPPSSGASACNNGWLCEHRIRAIKNMVAFRNNTSTAFSVTNYWDNGNNQLAWGRGGLGYVVINREDGGTLSRTFATGMAAGSYCDIIHGDFNYTTGACSGPTITVDGSGNANFSVNNRDAVAFHVGAKVGLPCTTCGGTSTATPTSSSSAGSTSSSSDAWYFRGTPNSWASTAMTLQGGLYCTEQQFGAAGTSPRFKVDHYANWVESYPAADYVVSANTKYQICINPSSHAVTATVVSASTSSAIATVTSSSAVANSSASSAMVASSVAVVASSSVAPSSSSSAAATGYFQLETNQYTVNEADGSFEVIVSRVGGTSGAASVTLAVAGSDKSLINVNQTVSFTNGEPQKTVVVNIANNTVYQGNKIVALVLSNPIGGMLSEGVSASVAITDDEQPPTAGTLQLSNSAYSLSEADGEIMLTIERSTGSVGAISVVVTTRDVTAVAGVDYVAKTTTVDFANGELSKQVNVAVNNDTSYTGSRAFSVELSDATGGAVLSDPSSALVTIQEDDPAPAAGVLQFAKASYSVTEGTANVTLTVSRTNGSFGAASVSYAVVNGTAVRGQDFEGNDNTLFFGDGETSKTIVLEIIDDTTVEAAEKFTVVLSNPSEAILGSITTSEVTITDNDTAPIKTAGGAMSPWYLLLMALLFFPWRTLNAQQMQLVRVKTKR